jgi:hypothetical protein
MSSAGTSQKQLNRGTIHVFFLLRKKQTIFKRRPLPQLDPLFFVRSANGYNMLCTT